VSAALAMPALSALQLGMEKKSVVQSPQVHLLVLIVVACMHSVNCGLNDEVVKGLSKARGEKFAYDCYRR
jgi:hypothetical protein